MNNFRFYKKEAHGTDKQEPLRHHNISFVNFIGAKVRIFLKKSKLGKYFFCPKHFALARWPREFFHLKTNRLHSPLGACLGSISN